MFMSALIIQSPLAGKLKHATLAELFLSAALRKIAAYLRI